MTTSTIRAERKIALPTRYPALTTTSALSQDIVTLSPPVSPSVVARILMIQKPSVTSGTFVSWSSSAMILSGDAHGSSIVRGILRPLCGRCGRYFAAVNYRRVLREQPAGKT
jgi:hypothetical protein